LGAVSPRWLIFKMGGWGDVRAEARTLQSDEQQPQVPFDVAQGRHSAPHPFDKLRVRSLRMTEILEIRGIPGLNIETWGTRHPAIFRG
jgi:hypothetical protein